MKAKEKKKDTKKGEELTHPKSQDPSFRPSKTQKVDPKIDTAKTSNKGYFEDMERDPNLEKKDIDDLRESITENPQPTPPKSSEIPGTAEKARMSIREEQAELNKKGRE